MGERFEHVLIFACNAAVLNVAILPGTKFVHDEDNAVVAAELDNLLADVGKSLLVFRLEMGADEIRRSDFLTEFFGAMLRTKLRCTELMVLLEVGINSHFEMSGRLLFIPLQGEFGTGDADFLRQFRSEFSETLNDLVFENPHEAVELSTTRVPQALDRKRHGEKAELGDGVLVFVAEFLVAQKLPDLLLTAPHQQAQHRAKE
ncbi:MAG: hypothetical protein ACR2OZ_02300 [Verrucomicrobiales bacterium]